MQTFYTLQADGLTLKVALTDDPTECWLEIVGEDKRRVLLPMQSTTALREIRRAISAMLDHRATLTTQED